MGKREYVVGIDIGSSQVVMAVGVCENRGDVTVLGVETQKFDRCVVNGEIKNYIPVANAIKKAKEELERELNIQLHSAYVGISGSSVYCVRYEDYVDVNGDVREADIHELHSRIEMVGSPAGDTIVDRIPLEYSVDNAKDVRELIGTFGNKLYATYLFVLASREQVSRVRQVMDFAGMTIAGFCVNPTLLHDVLLTKEERSSGVVIVDIGADLTDIIYVRNDKLNYFTSLPIGSSSIDADLANFLPIFKSDITSIKHKYGSAVADEVPGDLSISVQLAGRGPKKQILKRNIAEIAEARLQDIAGFVLESLKYMKAEKAPFGVVLTGGASYLSGIDTLFARELDMPVRVAEEMNGINCAMHVSPCSQSVVSGLLLYGTKHTSCSVTENAPIPTPAPAPTPEPIPTLVPEPKPEPKPEPAPNDVEQPQKPDTPQTEDVEQNGEKTYGEATQGGATESEGDTTTEGDTTPTDETPTNKLGGRLRNLFKGIKETTQSAYNKIDNFFSQDEEI